MKLVHRRVLIVGEAASASAAAVESGRWLKER